MEKIEEMACYKKVIQKKTVEKENLNWWRRKCRNSNAKIEYGNFTLELEQSW